MHRIELADTLIALLEAMEAPPGLGLSVVEASLEMPMEVLGIEVGGRLVFYAAPAHSRWKSGVLMPLQRSALRMVALERDDAAGRGLA